MARRSATVPDALRRAMQAHKAGRTSEAAAHYRRFLALHPRNPDVWELLAVTLAELGRWDDTVTASDRGLGMEPGNVDLHTLRIRALRSAGRPEAAFEAADVALRAVQPSANLLIAAAQAAVMIGRNDEAVAWSRRAAALDPHRAEAPTLQAMALRRQERHLEALRLLEKAIRDAPTLALAWYEAGVVRYELGEATEPLRCIRQAIELDPTDSAFHSGAAMVLTRLGRFEEAVEAYERALALKPGDALLISNQAWPLIGSGNFSRGWSQHEQAFALGGRAPNRQFPVPRWDGSADAGRLLVWREQGIGDEVRFASMMNDVIDLVGDVVLECSPRLVSLFRRTFPSIEVRAQRLDGVADYDVHCPMQSLAAFVRPDVDSYRRGADFLRADPGLVEQFSSVVRHRSGDDKLNVGISWRSMMLATRRLSHYTVLSEWTPVLSVPGVRFWNLQYGDNAMLDAEREQLLRELGTDLEVVDGLDYTNDFESIAALVSNLDLVVSVGTAVACLSGALGVPTITLEQDHGPLRFGQPDDPWFPGMKVLARQPEEPWGGVMQEAAQRVASLVDRRADR